MFGSKATFGTMVIVGVASALAACTAVVSPLTIAERVIEDRSFSDIATDNRIVLDANKAMADSGIISVSTAIYEQRLLMTGISKTRRTTTPSSPISRRFPGSRNSIGTSPK